MLIDIEALKQGKGLRKKKKNFRSIDVTSEVFDPHFCYDKGCSKSTSRKFNIDSLLTQTIMK